MFNRHDKGGAHQRSAFVPQNRHPGFKGPRPQPQAEPPKNLASALRVKNFRLLLEAAGEEGLGIALDLPIPRIKELSEGLNFSNETTHHIETTLRLTSGFLDQVNPQLTDSDIARLKSAPQDERVDELPPPAAKTAATESVSTSDNTLKESSMPRTPSQEPSQQAAAPAGNEEALREVRRLNLMMLTQGSGAKTQLGRLTGLSAANVSHRLHGNKIFDRETADFFCQQLGLPEGWFEAQRTEADVPDNTKALLSGAAGATAPAAGSLPAKKTRAPRQPKAAPAVATNLAPTQAQAGSISLSSAALGNPSASAAPTAAPTAQPAVAPVAGRRGRRPAVTQAAAAPMTPSTASATPAPTAAAPVAHAAAAPVAAPAAPISVATLAMTPKEGGVGPIAEALIRTLADKSRAGRLAEERALQMLVEAAAL